MISEVLVFVRHLLGRYSALSCVLYRPIIGTIVMLITQLKKEST